MFVDVPRFGNHQSHDKAIFVGPVDYIIHILEKPLVGPSRIAVEERLLPQERRRSVRMTNVQATENIGLEDGEPLIGPIFQVLSQFLVIEPLKYQPGRIAQVKEGLAVLIDKVSTIGADLESQVFDRTFREIGSPCQTCRTEDGEKHRTREGIIHGSTPGMKAIGR